MNRRNLFRVAVFVVLSTQVFAQAAPSKPAATSAATAKVGVLDAQQVKQLMPSTVFFRGQSAPVQIRNSGGVRAKNGFLVLSALVDNSGYASSVAEKYQAYFLTELKLKIEGKPVTPGAYGIGFVENGEFVLMDIGANDLLKVPGHADANMRRAVPLKIVEDGGGYRLYFGKRYVSFTVEQ